MADNTTAAGKSQRAHLHHHKQLQPTTKSTSSLIKGYSIGSTSDTGSMSSITSAASNKAHTLKHGLNMSHSKTSNLSSSGTSSSTGGVNPDTTSITIGSNKHHHHHHHHHHHSHSQNNPHNVIHRTTSESLRLGSDVTNSSSIISGHHSSSSASTNCNSSSTSLNTTSSGGGASSHMSTPSATIQRKPKTSSFQITSVTVGNKLSADNGEDSADDLDESHTDDNSRITDLENETPSMSEDTFSKEDVFFSSSALGAAPVIPTSSQYGLVIVDPDLGGVGTGGQTLSNVHVSVTDAGINIVGPAGTKLCDSDQKDLQHRNERFKVVKIESTEPFKRGRWMCMDYLDHTTLQQSQPNSENSSAAQSVGTVTTTSGNAMTNDSGVNVNENHIDGTEDPPDINTHLHMQQSLPVSPDQSMQKPISVSVVEQISAGAGAGNVSNTIHAQTLTHVPNAPQVSMPHQNITPQSLPHVSIQQNIPGGQTAPTTQQQHQQHQPPQHTSVEFTTQVNNSNIQGQSQPAQFYANNQHQAHIHGATLPSNLTMQNGVPTNLPSLTEQPPPPQQQDVPQSIQSVQTVHQQQLQQQNPISTTSIPISGAVSSNIGLQEHVTTSLPQSMVHQQQQQQQQVTTSMPGTILHQQTPPSQLQPQNVSQTQIPGGESYVSHSVAQSYTAPPPVAATSSLSNVPTGQDINSDISTVAMSQTPQGSGVLSPAGAGTPASSVAPPIDQTIQPSAVGPQPGIISSIPSSVISETSSTPSVASSISDPTALIATTSQPQPQQVPITAPPALQTQQSVITTGEESQQVVAGETDNER